jgi:hypothetical protein
MTWTLDHAPEVATGVMEDMVVVCILLLLLSYLTLKNACDTPSLSPIESTFSYLIRRYLGACLAYEAKRPAFAIFTHSVRVECFLTLSHRDSDRTAS